MIEGSDILVQPFDPPARRLWSRARRLLEEFDDGGKKSISRIGRKQADVPGHEASARRKELGRTGEAVDVQPTSREVGWPERSRQRVAIRIAGDLAQHIVAATGSSKADRRSELRS